MNKHAPSLNTEAEWWLVTSKVSLTKILILFGENGVVLPMRTLPPVVRAGWLPSQARSSATKSKLTTSSFHFQLHSKTRTVPQWNIGSLYNAAQVVLQKPLVGEHSGGTRRALSEMESRRKQRSYADKKYSITKTCIPHIFG